MQVRSAHAAGLEPGRAAEPVVAETHAGKAFCRARRDEYEPSCEACGYDLAGLDLHEKCSECGRSVLASMPQTRPGSAWQQRPSIAAWWRTSWATLCQPAVLFSSVRIEFRGGLSLAIINCLLAAAMLVLPWAGTLIGDPVRSVRLSQTSRGLSSPARELLAFSWVVPIQILVVAALLLLGTLFEFIGIRFIAGRRRWKLTRAGAWQVCAHATVGWLGLALAPMFALAAMYVLQFVFPSTLAITVDLRRAGLGMTSVGTLLLWTVPLGLFIAGVFVFELLVHIGVGRCKHAATLGHGGTSPGTQGNSLLAEMPAEVAAGE